MGELDGDAFAAVVQLEVRARENALHWMVGRVTGGSGAALVASRTEIVIVTDQAFVATTTEVGDQARVAADA